MKILWRFSFIGFFVVLLNSPLSLFASGEFDGVWIGLERVYFQEEQESLTTYAVIFQESDTTLYISDDLFGSVLLIKSGNQWVLPSPLETTLWGYKCTVTECSINFQSESYLTGNITVTV
jgi:hypothetical protein